jgi:hypothetical protein
MMQTIELDCAPGGLRPGDLIDGVLEGTGIEAGDTVSRLFGNWVWAFEMERDEWVEKVQPIVRPRIQALHASGLIRYGSW